MRSAALIVAAFLGFALAASYPVNASAAEYGAIAYDSNAGKIGWSWHAPTIAAANTAAFNACGGSAGCKVVIEIGPGLCGALATGQNPAVWGAASRNTRDAAALGAMEDCQKANRGQCKVQGSDCNK